jgi:hypothetical protein
LAVEPTPGKGLSRRSVTWVRGLAWLAGMVALAFVVLWVGTLVHECGHALVGVACGVEVERMNVLGVDLYPRLRIDYQAGYFGRVWFSRGLSYPQDEWMRAAGSLSTLAVAMACQAALWLRPSQRRWLQTLIVGFCFSWLDIFWHTSLALLGRRSMIYAEAYSALVALGVPRLALSAAIFGVSGLLLAATMMRWRMLRRAARSEGEEADRTEEPAVD